MWMGMGMLRGMCDEREVRARVRCLLCWRYMVFERKQGHGCRRDLGLDFDRERAAVVAGRRDGPVEAVSASWVRLVTLPSERWWAGSMTMTRKEKQANMTARPTTNDVNDNQGRCTFIHYNGQIP